MKKASTPNERNFTTPWPEPVDGVQLFRDGLKEIHRHLIVSEHGAVAMVGWGIQSWCPERFAHAALLVFDAPEHACGKSLGLDLMARLVRKPRELSGITEAAMFRIIETDRPTLMLDEVDMYIERNDGLVAVLNSGHAADGAVTRLEKVGDAYVPRDFRTFGCKALAGIDLQRKLPPQTLTRCIRIGLRRKLPGEEVKRLRKTDPKVFADLRARTLRFVQDKGEQLAEGFEDMPEELSDRDQDNWAPLFAIANAAGPEALEMVRAAALSIKGATEVPQSLSNRALADVRTVLADYDQPKISTDDLLTKLHRAGGEMGWNTYNRGYELTARQLAGFLRPYGLSPRTVRNTETGKTPKGYWLCDLAEAFKHYLPPLEPPGSEGDPAPAADDADGDGDPTGPDTNDY